MSNIITKYGTFSVEDNGQGGTILSIGNVKIAEFANVSWWNYDSLENATDHNGEMISSKVREIFTDNNLQGVIVTRENASQILQELVNVLGNEKKGFYASRLKQCINKLNKVA